MGPLRPSIPPQPVESGRREAFAARAPRAVALLLAIVLTAVLAPGGAGAARLFTLETEHFLVHFDGGYEALAHEVARIAEEVHRELAPRVGHVPSEKTHLVLADTTDLANGTADPLLYPKITLFPASPTFFSPYGSGISPRMREWLRLVILHEYAHVLHLDMNDGPGRVMALLFGRVPILTNPMMLQSFAFIEGFATYQETVADLGGRGHDPYYHMFLRAMVLEDDLLRLDQILGHYPLERWKPGGIVYLYGYSLWAFMASRSGEEALEAFNRAFARTTSLDQAFQEALGTTPEAFYQEWQAHLRRVYEPEIERLRAEGLTPTQPLGGQGYVPESPVASPDGRRLAYVTVHGPVAPALRLMAWDGETVRDRQLVAGLLMGPIAWSPDGQSLYYAKVEADGGRTFTDLYAYHLATGREERLTRGLRAFGPAPSPDGRRLVFSSREGPTTRLLEVDLAGPWPVEPDSSRLRELLPARGERQVLAFGWFPGGDGILVASHEPGGGMDLLRLDRATGRLEPLVVGSRARGGPGVVHQNAQFTPDGRWILFDSDQTGIPTLYAYELASGQIVQVARTLTGLFDPTVIQTDEGPRLVAMEYTARGYRLSLLPFSPALWTRVDPPVTARDPAEVPGVAAPLLDPDEPDPAAPVAPKPQGGSPSPGQGVGSSSAVRPYRPWDSLRPRFALPLILEDEAGPVVGALTLGYDAYRERVYALTGGLGLVSGRPWVAFEYQGPLFGHPQATWALGVRQETLLEDGKKAGRLERELQLGLAYTWPGVLAATSVAATAKLWDDEPVGDGSGLAGPGQAVTLGVGREQAWPVDGRSFTLASGLSLTGFREGADGSRQGVVATWREQAAFSWNLGRQRLVLDGVVGTASLEEALAVGDPTASRAVDRSLWTLQAHGPTLTGRHALRITLGLESQLYRFSRGVGTWPLFFDDLGGRLYLEGGAVWSDTEAALQRRWGAGAELTLTTYLGYATPLTLGVGVASSIEPAGSPTLYLRVDLTDPVGAGAGGRLSGAGAAAVAGLGRGGG